LPTNINPFSDTESEAQVLMAFLIEPELIYQVNVSTRDFTSTEYRAIYEAMLKLYSEGISFQDPKAIIDFNSQIKAETIIALMSKSFTSANIKYHSKILKQKTFNRKSRDVVSILQSKIGEDDFLHDMESGILKLYESQSIGKYITTAEGLSLVRTRINDAKQAEHYGIQTGFYRLNDCILGLCPKHLIMLGGYTSHGKSTLMSQIVAGVCRNDARVLIFSVEDSIEDKLIRLIATVTGEPIRSILRGYANEDRLLAAQLQIEKWGIHIYDDVYNLEEMDMKIKKHKLQGGVDIVVIDFVQNIQAKGEGIYDRMSEVAIKLQQIAKRHNVCVLALSQISKDNNLRGAQELESAADIVLWIDRDKDANLTDNRNFNLLVRKNRPFGKTGRIEMCFSETWTGIKEIYREG